MSEDWEEVMLPKAWRTTSQLRSQVHAPSCVRQDSTVGLDMDGSSVSTTATIVLYGFFASTQTRKRSRGDKSMERDLDSGSSRSRGRSGSNTASAACCTPVLRRFVDAVLQSAHSSMGHADTDTIPDAVVILHATLKALHEQHESPSLETQTRCSPVWYFEGVCVAEPISRAFRAATAASDLPVPAPSAPPTALCPSTTAHLCGAQATHIGDVWCVGTIFCGIRLFCVAPVARGRGVAFSMVETARRLLCYGYEVPAAHVAFSEPTLMGSRFARRYHSRDDFLVY